MRRVTIYTLVFFSGFTFGILSNTSSVSVPNNTASIIQREQKRQKYDTLLSNVRKCGKYVCK
jgi:hypothetical protein